MNLVQISRSLSAFFPARSSGFNPCVDESECATENRRGKAETGKAATRCMNCFKSVHLRLRMGIKP